MIRLPRRLSTYLAIGDFGTDTNVNVMATQTLNQVVDRVSEDIHPESGLLQAFKMTGKHAGEPVERSLSYQAVDCVWVRETQHIA